MQGGYVYVLTNPLHKRVVKIGKTTKRASERAAELSRGTGVIGRIDVHIEMRCDDIDHAAAR